MKADSESVMSTLEKPCQHLSTEELKAAKNSIRSESDFFDSTTTGITDSVKHRIDTGQAHPIRQPPRRIQFAKQQEVEERVDKMMKEFPSGTMRRSSILRTQTSEPLIVVEDEEHEEEKHESSSRQSSEDESTSMNPYLLSPYAREIRKHSLPTPQCSGITASQVRRLSERAETAGPGPRQAEFLATLSSAPQASPSGRRHSVVTISRVPPAFFGRNRRESVAAFATSSFPNRILPNRRESIACPSTEPRGSVHNLQLDIMDDIVQARKVRMKMWNTSSEKVCEVQPLDETGDVQRYTNSGRRFSDFVGTTLAPIPSMSKRRASELPPSTPSTSAGPSKKPSSGKVCSNNHLISILSSLSTSATEINQCKKDQPQVKSSGQRKRGQLKNARSNSFDLSTLQETDNPHESSGWFAKRHQPISKTEVSKLASPANIKKKDTKKVVEKEPYRFFWDRNSGSIVDPHALGNAIGMFLRKPSPEASTSFAGRAKKWFSKGVEESTKACDSSICSTLKDLFVK